MIFDLLDSNVWLALYSARHLHHSAALSWHTAKGEQYGSAFRRVTQMAFLRHLTNRAIMQADTLEPAAAWNCFQQLNSSEDVTVLPEPPNLEGKWVSLSSGLGASGSWWTDAYLAAFAIESRIRLITFDRGFRRFEADGLSVHVIGTPAP